VDASGSALTVAVLFQGAGWCAVDKPAGTLVIPGRGGGACLREQLERDLGRKLWVVHRLDQGTSGVLAFALDATTHRALSQAFEAGQIRKKYLALVEGDVAEPWTCRAALVPARRGRMRVARPDEKGKPASTFFRPVERLGVATVVEAEPRTGRTHQIRVHLAASGHPLVVDPQYGAAAWEPLGGILSRTPLHASTLLVPDLQTVAGATVSAPLPKDMAQALDKLRAR
jgi:RluA family pseudouridine synthase